MYKLVSVKVHSTGVQEFVSIFDGITRSVPPLIDSECLAGHTPSLLQADTRSANPPRIKTWDSLCAQASATLSPAPPRFRESTGKFHPPKRETRNNREMTICSVPCSSVDGMAVLKVLASGKGFRQGPVLSFPKILPVSVAAGPF